MSEKPLVESRLKQEHGIQVLLVERGGIKIERAKADTVFLPGDPLTVFGTIRRSARFSRRRSVSSSEKTIERRKKEGVS